MRTSARLFRRLRESTNPRMPLACEGFDPRVSYREKKESSAGVFRDLRDLRDDTNPSSLAFWSGIFVLLCYCPLGNVYTGRFQSNLNALTSKSLCLWHNISIRALRPL